MTAGGVDTAVASAPTSADAFYAGLVERNRGLVDEATQRALASARVLVAGCGSTGGAAIEPLTRLGVQHFVLAEPGRYELNNLNRQHAELADLDRNKAEVGARRVLAVNPHASVRVETDGITDTNAAALVSASDVIVDGVDVTTMSGWRAKYALHVQAARLGRPVVSGYDMSGTQHVRYYAYDGQLAPLAGEVLAADLDEATQWDLLLRIVPREIVPADLIADIRAHRDDPDYSVPQLVYTSHLFGVLTARYVARIVAGDAVRDAVTVDVHALVSPTPA